MAATSGVLRGIIFLSAGVSLFGVVDGLSKMLVDAQSFGQIMLARYALALPLLLLFVGPSRWKPLFATRKPGLQILRALSPFMIGGAMVIGLAHMTLADATVILFAGPFAVVALSGYVLKERVSLMSWIGVALGFLAVILVARPGLGAFTPYVIFPIIAAVFYAVFQLLSRHLAMAGEDANGTLAWTLGIGLLLAIPLALWEWRALDAAAWGLSFALAMAFAAAHLFIVRAYDLALANVLAPFSYVQIAAAVLFGIIAFDALPDAWTLAGILLIVIAAALVIKESRQASG